MAPRKECGAQASGITPSTKESDLKYLKKIAQPKGKDCNVYSRRIKHGIGKCKIYRIGCANCDKGPSWTVLSRAAVYQVTCSEHHAVR